MIEFLFFQVLHFKTLLCTNYFVFCFGVLLENTKTHSSDALVHPLRVDVRMALVDPFSAILAVWQSGSGRGFKMLVKVASIIAAITPF